MLVEELDRSGFKVVTLGSDLSGTPLREDGQNELIGVVATPL